MVGKTTVWMKKVTDELICRYQIHYAMDTQAEILLHLYNY